MNDKVSITVGNVIIKSHPKSVIRPIEISSPAYHSIFSNAKPYGYIDGDYQAVIVLQATISDNYVIAEIISKKNYEN